MKAAAAILIVLFNCSEAFCSEGGQEGIFGGSFGDAVWTVAAFMLLLIVLGKVAWKPLLAGLKAREEHIKQEIEQAEGSRKRAEKMLEDYRAQGVDIIQKAAEQAQRRQQQTEELIRQESLAVEKKARDDIERARISASEQLWDHAGDVVLALSKEVLGRNITSHDNKRLIDEAVDRLKNSDFKRVGL